MRWLRVILAAVALGLLADKGYLSSTLVVTTGFVILPLWMVFAQGRARRRGPPSDASDRATTKRRTLMMVASVYLSIGLASLLASVDRVAPWRWTITLGLFAVVDAYLLSRAGQQTDGR
jgi:hypothetical protein